MNGQDEDMGTGEGEKACPFCGSADDCEHLLLLLDLTFRTAEGGPLAEAFGDRWELISNREDGEFDEREAFDEQLDEVDSLADASLEYVIEGGPGMTSEYAAYFCSSEERVTAAVKNFAVASARYDTVEGDQCPFCHKINAPAAGDTCEHHVGWKWDGAFELDTDLVDLQRAWQEAADNIQSQLGETDFNRRLTAVVEGVDLHQKLVERASGDAEFGDLLEAVGVQVGGGWQTNGMLGGSGHNLYANDRKRLTDAAAFYDSICQEAEQSKGSAPAKHQPPAKSKDRQKRAVLLIVTKWPSGTMAFKFGYAMRRALRSSVEDMKLVQAEPERIFRIETDVSEIEFRNAMAESDVSSSGRVIFVEM